MNFARAVVLALASATSLAAGTAPAPGPAVGAVALVPLDDRPVNLQDVQLAGTLAGVAVTAPPRYRLGRGDAEGDADGIAEWLDALDVSKTDTVIVSTDMLAFGGFRASRRADVAAEKALSRLKALGRLKSRRSGVRVFAFTTLLGPSLADDGHKGAWKTALARWAELGGPDATAPAVAAEARAIEQQIPSTMLDRYKAARARNLAVTETAIELLAHGEVDYLVVAAEEDAPCGICAAERAHVSGELAASIAAHHAAIVIRADPVATLLVTRALAAPGRHVALEMVPESGMSPASAAAQQSLEIAGVASVARAGAGDATAVIYSGNNAASASAAAQKVDRALSSGGRVVVADIGSAGTGSNVPLIEALRIKHAFQRLWGYSSGDAPVAVARALAAAVISRDDAAARAAREQVLLNRLAVDFAYAAVARPDAPEDYFTPNHLDVGHLSLDQIQRAEVYLSGQVKPLVENLITDVSAPTRSHRVGPIAVRDVNDFKLKLASGGLDDVEISFVLTP
jgi:uncharacterized protein DUF4127